MMNFIDAWLNKTTMYRVVLYYLVALIALAFGFSFFGLLPFSPFDLFISVYALVVGCWLSNIAIARFFGAQTNVESTHITALILVLIMNPTHTFFGFTVLLWAAIIATSSKYLLSINNKHLFNPAAIAVVFTALALNESASWWVGRTLLVPFVFLGGLLIVKKIRRVDLVFSFVFVSLTTTFILGVLNHSNVVILAKESLLNSSMWFLAFVMLTEPLTTPPTMHLQVAYGAIVGILFAPQTHIGSFYFSPEYALLIGNAFTYIVSPKQKLVLKLKDRIALGPSMYDFVFSSDMKMPFAAGQYLEWTLGHASPDSRGNRRYFTIASSPTEPDIHLGVKFYDKPSTFKQKLLTLAPGDSIIASQLSGDFTLPKNPAQPCVFIAGGIGITPFRSMIKSLVDTNTVRPCALFYCVKTVDEIAYKEIFDAAEQKLGIPTIYMLATEKVAPDGLDCKLGMLDEATIRERIPNFTDCMFYISGPHGMVNAFEKTLSEMGIKANHIKTDFFPGFV